MQRMWDVRSLQRCVDLEAVSDRGDADLLERLVERLFAVAARASDQQSQVETLTSKWLNVPDTRTTLGRISQIQDTRLWCINVVKLGKAHHAKLTSPSWQSCGGSESRVQVSKLRACVGMRFEKCVRQVCARMCRRAG
eukprot:2287265-Pleurochrysis_carterae.AAC.2